MDERRVEMLRLERKEEAYDRDEVLGRDASSVFPSHKKNGQGANPAAAVLQEMLGTRTFVSQSELDEIKRERGMTGDETGSSAPLRPLAEVLRENRERKQQAFDDQWKQMKTGKNAPLEPEELEFLDQLAEAEAARLRETSQHESQELEEFRKMLVEQEAQKAAAEQRGQAPQSRPMLKPGAAIGPKVEPKKPLNHYPRANFKPVVRPKTQAPKAAGFSDKQQDEQQQDKGIQIAKRAKVDVEGSEKKEGKIAESGFEETEGLAGLLDSYCD